MKQQWIIWLMGMCFAVSASAKTHTGAELTHQETVLSTCLNINYAKIGADLKDYSGNKYTYGTRIKITDFVEKEAGHFYQKSYPIYSENTPPPYTKIFSQCVHFSKSQKVKRFLKTLDLSICKPHSTRNDCPE